MRINVHNHKRAMNDNIRSMITNTIQSNLHAPARIEKVDVFHFDGTKSSYQETNKKRLLIIIDSHFEPYTGETVEMEGLDIFGTTLPHKITLRSIEGQGIPFITRDGFAVAEYFPDHNTLYIAFDIINQGFNAYEQSAFASILKELNKQYEDEYKQYSWKYATDKTRLSNEMTERATRAARQEEEQVRERVERYKRDVTEVTNQLNNVYRNLFTSQQRLDSFNGLSDKVVERIMRDLDLIVAHEKIKDLRIMDGKLTVYTNHLNIFDDKGNEYVGGEYRIELHPENNDVKFYGTNTRRGYWTRNDPHPHVSGNSAGACLGSVAPTIAELSSQYELYALTLVCIDFLEAANTSDPAGAKVRNWDKVVNGVVIPAPVFKKCSYGTCDHEGTNVCDDTGEHYCDEHFYRGVIRQDGTLGGVGRRAINNNYTLNDDYEVYIHHECELDDSDIRALLEIEEEEADSPDDTDLL